MARSDSYKDLEELGIDCEVQDELTSQFNKAANHLQTIVSKVDNTNLVLLYGYYKQANEGRCKIAKPGWFDTKGRHKWEAWHKLGDMSAKDAKLMYIETLKKLDSSFNFETVKKEGWVTVSTLQSTNPIIDESQKNLLDYIKEDDAITVTDILKSYPKGKLENVLSQLDDHGLGLVHWAADRGSMQMLQLLLSMGANVDLVDSDQQTPLHYAACCGHVDCIRLLLDYGANSSVVDINGETPCDVCSDQATKALFLK